MSRTLSGLFLVGALNRPRKRKRTNRENPWTIPEQIPVLPFLVFFFFAKKNNQGKSPKKKQGFFIPTEPLKSLERKGKTLKKTRNSLIPKKTRNSKKNKERKDMDRENPRKSGKSQKGQKRKDKSRSGSPPV